MSNAAPYFKLFYGIRDKALMQPGMAASLQALETCFYLVAMNRWPSVVTQGCVAVELALKVLYEPSSGPKPRAGRGLEQLIQEHEQSSSISAPLSESAHLLRKFRNHCVHDGHSPRDDDEARAALLFATVPYFENLFKCIFKEELINLLDPTARWFWANYKASRKVSPKRRAACAKNFFPPLDPVATELFELACARIVRQDGRFHEHLMPYEGCVDEYAHENAQDVVFEAELQREARFVNRFGDPDEVFDMGNIACPVCSQPDLRFEPAWDNEDAYLARRFAKVGCVRCDYLVDDNRVIDAYFSDSSEAILGDGLHLDELHKRFGSPYSVP